MKAKAITSSLIVSAMLACAGIAPAMAQHTDMPNINVTRHQIRARIQQGIASGHITEQERQVLYQREREIQFRESRMKRDGIVTPEERRQLWQDLDDLRAEVDRKLSNRRITEPYGTRTPGVDRTQQEIHARIENGIHSGHITRAEADKLFAQERRLQWRKANFTSDGHISREERRELQREVAMLSDDVESMLYNDRRRAR